MTDREWFMANKPICHDMPDEELLKLLFRDFHYAARLRFTRSPSALEWIISEARWEMKNAPQGIRAMALQRTDYNPPLPNWDGY